MSLVLHLGSEKDVEFVRQMTDYFSKVFDKSDILRLDGPLSTELQNLSAYGLDPEELKADKINKLVADVKNFFSQKEADEKRLSGCLSLVPWCRGVGECEDNRQDVT